MRKLDPIQHHLLLLSNHVQNKLLSLDFSGSNGRGHGNDGGACCIVDQMGIKSRQCHRD